MKFIYDTNIFLLSDNAFKIYMFIQRENKEYTLSVDYISDKLGKSISTVRRGLRELKKHI